MDLIPWFKRFLSQIELEGSRACMSDSHNMISTVLDGVSTFIAHHDKEKLQDIFVLDRQKNDLFQLFSGGTADDPDCLEDWQAVTYFLEYFLNGQVKRRIGLSLN
jgi:hypothetical protein